ncbi:CDP-glycerol glycerophosphotransferase family protein [Clostridium nigeriense]|uniref:CDP-glycerol glycerophosphotransferase family protein n=1 Tax=Clostridium nigeriense TaxID=1805470 RepID=UPI003D33AE3D
MIEVLINGNEIYAVNSGEKTSIDKNIISCDISVEINRFIKNLEKESVNNTAIKDMYIYDDIEVYNFARGTICNKVKDILSKFLLIEALVDKFGEEKIKIYTSDPVYKYICNSLFKIAISEVQDNIDINKENKEPNNKMMKTKRIFKGFIFLLKYKFKNIRNENILFMTHCSDINNIKIGNKNLHYDCQFGEVLESFKKEKNVFRIQYLNNDSILNKSEKIGDDFFPFEDFIILKKILYRMKLNQDKLNNRLYLLKDFNLNFHNYNLYGLFNEFLFKNLKDIFDSYIYEIYSAEKFLKILKFDKIICTDEADRARCFIYSGNKLNIPTFAIQHGIITEASVSYFIPSKENIYVPSKTFVWGEEFKEKLLEGTIIYNDNNVVVVGQPRTDYLYNKISNTDIGQTRDENLKILYATQYIKELAREATEFLFSSLSKYGEKYEVIIKLHPNDTYYDMYDEIAKKYNVNNIKITKDMDIYDAIIWSDIVISVHSTVNLEAAVLNKPSICLLLNNYWDQGNFVKNNISKGAKNEEELIDLLNDINWDANDRYIERNFYKVDGLVANRIKEVINSY